MKNKNRRLIPLLLALPFLMGNAPAPQVFSDDYKDFQIEYIKEEQADGKYIYTYHLNNTGDGYICQLGLYKYVQIGKDEYNVYSLGYTLYRGRIFNDTVLPPGFNQDLEMTSERKIPEPEKMSKDIEAYTIFDKEISFSGSREITEKKNASSYYGESYYYYQVDLKVDNPDTSEWNYGFILDITYKGTNYYVKIDEKRNYQLEAQEKLDLDNIVINNAIVIKSRPSYYGVDKVFNIIVALLVVGFFFMISVGIFAAIFFPIMAKKRRARRLAIANQKNTSSNNDKL